MFTRTQKEVVVIVVLEEEDVIDTTGKRARHETPAASTPILRLCQRQNQVQNCGPSNASTLGSVNIRIFCDLGGEVLYVCFLLFFCLA